MKRIGAIILLMAFFLVFGFVGRMDMDAAEAACCSCDYVDPAGVNK